MDRVRITIDLESAKPAVPVAVLLRTFLKRALRLGNWRCSSVTMSESEQDDDG